MSSNLRVLVANTTNPFFNLATEDWIFHDMAPDGKVLFLWRNEPSIIVGRGQNVWSECALDKVEEDGVHVVRRHSGGGAVYQDLGNTCFTFMGSKENGFTTRELYARNNQILISALESFGIGAQASGRNDLVVEVDEQIFKVSGSAFRESKDRCFHHGTMLMNVDLSKLGDYLTPDNTKLAAKGIKSVKSRVANLQTLRPDLDHDSFLQALTVQFFAHYHATCEIEFLDESYLQSVESLATYYQKLKSWDWVYGKTPNFQHTMKTRFTWGGCELHLDTDKGVIMKAKVYSDALQPELLEEATAKLAGRPYSKAGVKSARAEWSKIALVEEPIVADYFHWVESEL